MYLSIRTRSNQWVLSCKAWLSPLSEGRTLSIEARTSFAHCLWWYSQQSYPFKRRPVSLAATCRHVDLTMDETTPEVVERAPFFSFQGKEANWKLLTIRAWHNLHRWFQIQLETDSSDREENSFRTATYYIKESRKKDRTLLNSYWHHALNLYYYYFFLFVSLVK